MSMAPLTVEQWADFVVAAAAHRSQNDKHAQFGSLLIQRYFVELPARYKDDQTASLYFDHMLCVVGSAIRAFSVVRDMFETKREAEKAASDQLTKSTEKLDAYAPLNEKGHCGKIGALVVALGLWAPLASWLSSSVKAWPVVAVGILAALVFLVLMASQLLVERLKTMLAVRYALQFPEDLQKQWQEGAMKGYGKAIRQFIASGAEITHRYYPDDPINNKLMESLGAHLDEIVAKRFALRSSRQNQSS